MFPAALKIVKIIKPRAVLFENVKGLLSDDSGRTFQEWINHLGGKINHYNSDSGGAVVEITLPLFNLEISDNEF